MPEIMTNCPDCNNKLKVNVGQSIVGDKLVWHRSIDCSYCGAAYEEDGVETPEDIRLAIIEREGTWGLSLVSSESRTIALKILRESLGLSLSDIAKLSKKETIMSGTQTEVQWLKNKMENIGVAVVVKQLK